MSLPARLGITDLADFSAPYLSVPTPPADYRVASNVAPGRKRIGFVWRGNPQHKNDHRRSLPILEFARFLPANNVDWISLQVGGDVSRELNRLRENIETIDASGNTKFNTTNTLPKITDAGSGLNDFHETAIKISTLTNVTTVDTAVAHLAGALGHKTMIIMQSPTDWRWGNAKHETIWYPSTRLKKRLQ
jgi:hypothetical protein